MTLNTISIQEEFFQQREAWKKCLSVTLFNLKPKAQKDAYIH